MIMFALITSCEYQEALEFGEHLDEADVALQRLSFVAPKFVPRAIKRPKPGFTLKIVRNVWPPGAERPSQRPLIPSEKGTTSKLLVLAYQEALEFGEHPDKADVVLQRHTPQPRLLIFLFETRFRVPGIGLRAVAHSRVREFADRV